MSINNVGPNSQEHNVWLILSVEKHSANSAPAW
jgi:hypothetical protein